MHDTNFDARIAGLATLDEPVRRRLYLYVASRHEEVGRDEAARAVGVSRALAGFHLDRLAEQGLLETSFRRLSGKTGPGAGRPAKLYRRSSRELAVTLPPRSYDFAAHLLAAAVEASSAPETREALREVARAAGERLGAQARGRGGDADGGARGLDEAMAVLAEHGYEPSRAGARIQLRNCPFHALADEHRDLVCGMNLALIEGMMSALDLPNRKVALDPQPGMCCVAVELTPG